MLSRAALCECVGLEELYADCNAIGEVERGALSTLRGLRVLTLHRNELRNLEALMRELQPLQFLRELSMQPLKFLRELSISTVSSG